MSITRNHFARITETAWMKQFGPDADPVMNDMVVTLETDPLDFGYCSSLTAEQARIPVLLVLDETMFGPEPVADGNIYDYISDGSNNGANDLWSDIWEAIMQVLYEAVLTESEYGDPDNSLYDWLSNGDYRDIDTIDAIVAEWDDGRQKS